jgi:hypothetical protein
MLEWMNEVEGAFVVIVDSKLKHTIARLTPSGEEPSFPPPPKDFHEGLKEI